MTKWTVDLIKDAAAFCVSRGDMAFKNKPAYEAARLMGLLDSLFDLQLNQWTPDAIRIEAAGYKTRTEFANGSGAAYNAARRLGMLNEVLPVTQKRWSVDEIEALAGTCANKKELKRRNPTVYNAALRLNIIDSLFTNSVSLNTRDCVYLWSVDGSDHLFKFGITSRALGEYRIYQVAKAAKVVPNLVMLCEVGYEKAKTIESTMRRMGTPYRFGWSFYGHTEFRHLTEKEVRECIDLMVLNRLTRSL